MASSAAGSTRPFSTSSDSSAFTRRAMSRGRLLAVVVVVVVVVVVAARHPARLGRGGRERKARSAGRGGRGHEKQGGMVDEMIAICDNIACRKRHPDRRPRGRPFLIRLPPAAGASGPQTARGRASMAREFAFRCVLLRPFASDRGRPATRGREHIIEMMQDSRRARDSDPAKTAISFSAKAARRSSTRVAAR